MERAGRVAGRSGRNRLPPLGGCGLAFRLGKIFRELLRRSLAYLTRSLA